ncbi:hypothetical protein QRX50_46785 [Amycolatopsis carbonis]|uniref:Uncharacterized protein n=1 Tax=Amycolatopsis carbonis TaxID=715471 RepID=A0A9Y2MRR7_9PSEU|nr:hypothetical protein [Amycolatopsis sp. 2-15]WIX78760.1 hypothetical protein QRX50_46785 [Amycolatopsis sp. 2-15]
MDFNRQARDQLARLNTHRGPVIASAVVVVIALLSAVWLDDTDAWAGLGQWAGAFGSVLAVTVALRISQRESDNARQLAQLDAEREAEQRRTEKEERELEQARLVVAAIEYPTIDEELNFKRQTGLEPLDAVRITNFSSRHVFNPRIEGFLHQNGGTIAWDVEAEFPGGYEAAPSVLGTGKEDVIPVALKYDPPVTEDDYPLRTKVILGFTDADGRRWRRFGEAAPRRVTADDTFGAGGPDWYRAS